MICQLLEFLSGFNFNTKPFEFLKCNQNQRPIIPLSFSRLEIIGRRGFECIHVRSHKQVSLSGARLMEKSRFSGYNHVLVYSLQIDYVNDKTLLSLILVVLPVFNILWHNKNKGGLASFGLGCLFKRCHTSDIHFDRGCFSRSRTSSGRYFTGMLPCSSTASW